MMFTVKNKLCYSKPNYPTIKANLTLAQLTGCLLKPNVTKSHPIRTSLT